jgi:hypothetical protein
MAKSYDDKIKQVKNLQELVDIIYDIAGFKPFTTDMGGFM